MNNNLWYSFFDSRYSWNEILQLLKCYFMNISDIDITEYYNPSLLHLAARSGDIKLLKKVLMHENVDANLPDKNGNTALHIATGNGSAEIVKCLVEEFKADINIENSYYNQTPFSIAINNLDTELTIFFISKNCKFKDASLPQQVGEISCKKYLEELYAQFIQRNDYKETLENIEELINIYNANVKEKIKQYESIAALLDIPMSIPDWLQLIDLNDSPKIDLSPLGDNHLHVD